MRGVAYPGRQVPTARQAPAPMPGGLLQVLLQPDQAADWTSMCRTAALTSTLTKLDIANSAQFSERIVLVCGVLLRVLLPSEPNSVGAGLV